MSASFTYSPPSVSLARAVRPVGVFRYDPHDAPGSKYELLPNIRVLSIEAPGEGAHPGAARFRYAFSDPLGSPNDPRRFEQVYPLSAVGRHIVYADDRLVVRAYHDDGSYELMFDGFVQIPQADVGRESEVVSFQALGVPIREWDTPIPGAIYRDGADPEAGKDTMTELPARFNPDGRANSTRGGHDTHQGGDNAYPVFLDWRIDRGEGVDVQAFWYLAEAARYLVFTGNPDQKYIKNPTATTLESRLFARVGTPDPDGPINIADESTYTLKSIECPDLDVTGDPWPVALSKLIEPFGFGLCFRLTKDAAGDPQWTFDLYYKDDNTHVKFLGLQRAGQAYDPAKTNVGELHLARDGAAIANRVVLDTAPVRYEAAFVLAPAFAIHATDADAANLVNWEVQDATGDPPKVTDWSTYREFIFGEAGDSWWDFGATGFSQTPPSLVSILGPSEAGKPGTARRRRPGRGVLISKDEKGVARRAELYVSCDYAGDAPAVWDPKASGAGTWQRVKHGGWELLEDQLGVRLTYKKVEGWPIDIQPKMANPPFPGGILNVVSSMANPKSRATDPVSTTPRIWFKLVCVIEGDRGLGVEAKRRAASPTIFTVTRHDDTRDRFAKHVVCKSSPYAADPAADSTPLDETPKAKAHAAARRRQSELGNFSGTVTIPRLVTSYQVGDKISRVKGRNVSLAQNAAAAAGESDVLPTVVGVAWNFDGGQSTVLSLGDRRAAPPPEHRNPRLTAMRPES